MPRCWRRGTVGLVCHANAIANMQAITERFGPSHGVSGGTMVGAFFIDIVNALVIKFFVPDAADVRLRSGVGVALSFGIQRSINACRLFRGSVHEYGGARR